MAHEGLADLAHHIGRRDRRGHLDRAERNGDDVTRDVCAPACASAGDTDGVRRIELRGSMPCARRHCGAPAWVAFAELDPDFPGMWLLLPISARMIAVVDDIRRRVWDLANRAGQRLRSIGVPPGVVAHPWWSLFCA